MCDSNKESIVTSIIYMCMVFQTSGDSQIELESLMKVFKLCKDLDGFL
jgi:hypothetical protein